MGVLTDTGTFGGTDSTGEETGCGTHLVQTVEVLVLVIVETVVVVWVVVRLPLVIVFVTGHVVKVVTTTSVV